jgi:ATP-grasp domain, R2K clade family 3
MHWVIQKNIFKPENYLALVESLDLLGIDYTSITIPGGTFSLIPEVNVGDNVYVCGALKLRKISQDRGWKPGSFLNENYSYEIWLDKLGHKMLNSDAIFGKFVDIQTSHLSKFFLRPLEDNKAFDGAIFDNEQLSIWKDDASKAHLKGTDVMASSVKPIYREYRLFYVAKKYATGSLYKMGGKPHINADVEADAIEFADSIITRWVPSESFVIDIALAPNGYKVIEFNNINSSGFYASDVRKYVQAIQCHYSHEA